jgi:hypothetical protein
MTTSGKKGPMPHTQRGETVVRRRILLALNLAIWRARSIARWLFQGIVLVEQP